MTRTIDYLAATYVDLGGRWTAALTCDDEREWNGEGSTIEDAARRALEQYVRSLNNPQRGD